MTKIRAYIEETINELVHKVSWPTWKELQNSSVIVLITSVMIAFAIFVMDYVMGINSDDALWKGVLGLMYEVLQDL